MAIISSENWKSLEAFLDKFPLKSTEVLADAEDSPPVGGDTSSDGEAADSGSQDTNSNEQDNELSGSEGSGDDSSMDMGGSPDSSGGDSYNSSSPTDTQSGDTSSSGDMSGGADTGSSMGGQAPTNPLENPFKTQNGQTLLDTKLSELLVAITDTLDRLQTSKVVDTVVVADLEALAESVKQIREMVFIVPVETSLYRYGLCVKSYELTSKALCTNILRVNSTNSIDDSVKDVMEDAQ